MLDLLFDFCFHCKKPANIENVSTKGTLLTVNMLCITGHESTWRSQPGIGLMAVGNLVMAASVLFSGNMYMRIKELFDLALIPFLSKTSFMEIQ